MEKTEIKIAKKILTKPKVKKVLDSFSDNGDSTVTEISRKLKYQYMTVFQIVKQLKNEGILLDKGKDGKKKYYALNSERINNLKSGYLEIQSDLSAYLNKLGARVLKTRKRLGKEIMSERKKQRLNLARVYKPSEITYLQYLDLEIGGAKYIVYDTFLPVLQTLDVSILLVDKDQSYNLKPFNEKVWFKVLEIFNEKFTTDQELESFLKRAKIQVDKFRQITSGERSCTIDTFLQIIFALGLDIKLIGKEVPIG